MFSTTLKENQVRILFDSCGQYGHMNIPSVPLCVALRELQTETATVP